MLSNLLYKFSVDAGLLYFQLLHAKLGLFYLPLLLHLLGNLLVAALFVASVCNLPRSCSADARTGKYKSYLYNISF